MRVPQDSIIMNWVHPYFFKNKDLIIMDVGCNVGEYIDLCLSNIAGTIKSIYGFEPNKEIYDKANQKFSSEPRVHIKNIALGNSVGKKKLFIPGKEREENGQKVWRQGAHALASLHDRKIWHTWNDCTLRTQQVETTTLDKFIESNDLERIDYVKVDVEGHELEVLKGAAKTFKSGIIKGGQFEYGGTFLDANITLKEVVQFLNDHGYNVYDCPPFSGLGLSTNVEDDYTWSNIVFKQRKK